MPSPEPNLQSRRVLPVVAGSASAFIGLAFLIYWLYFINKESVYDPPPPEGAGPLYALFYLALAVHLVLSVVAAVGLTIWSQAPRRQTFVAVALTYAVLMLPLLWVMTGFNICGTGHSFPIPGVPYTCGD